MEKLQAQNEALKKQCSSLQQEVKQWKKEYEILDACIELEQGKIAELKAENDRLKSRNKLYKKIITENIRKSKNQIMILNACIKGDLSVEEVKEYAKLEIENERLKEDIKEVKKYQYEQEYIDKEIEEMQKALKTLAEGLNIRQQTLQEIKEIATRAFAVCEDDCGNANKFTDILDLITKAEGK